MHMYRRDQIFFSWSVSLTCNPVLISPSQSVLCFHEVENCGCTQCLFLLFYDYLKDFVEKSHWWVCHCCFGGNLSHWFHLTWKAVINKWAVLSHHPKYSGASEKQEPERVSHAFPSNIFTMTPPWICTVFCSSAASSDSPVRNYTSIRNAYLQRHMWPWSTKTS